LENTATYFGLLSYVFLSLVANDMRKLRYKPTT